MLLDRLSAHRARPNRSPALRAQILATEHWSLLATRSMTWSEIFSRTGIFLTVLSAIVVALSLVAQELALGRRFASSPSWCFRSGSFGLGTYIRLVEADIEDVGSSRE